MKINIFKKVESSLGPFDIQLAIDHNFCVMYLFGFNTLFYFLA